jgi:hypothetical protein
MGQVTTPNINVSPIIDIPKVTVTKVVPAGYLGEFGLGLWTTFTSNRTFTVPAGVTSIRVRVVGAGGGSAEGVRSCGGGGGGYAHGVFAVTPGTSYAVTVGVGGGGGGGVGTAGTSSSFGAFSPK